jgi:hypothetical protein
MNKVEPVQADTPRDQGESVIEDLEVKADLMESMLVFLLIFC